MRRFSDLPVNRKLTLIILAASIPVLLVASGALVGYGLSRLRQSTERDLVMLAQIVGDNSTAALKFDNQSDAQDVLSTLRSQNEIVYACLYGGDGNLFAEYSPRDGPARSPVPRVPTQASAH